MGGMTFLGVVAAALLWIGGGGRHGGGGGDHLPVLRTVEKCPVPTPYVGMCLASLVQLCVCRFVFLFFEVWSYY